MTENKGVPLINGPLWLQIAAGVVSGFLTAFVFGVGRALWRLHRAEKTQKRHGE